MGKGRFINQKLGKNSSRKAGLLKSTLTARQKPKSPHISPNHPAPK